MTSTASYQRATCQTSTPVPEVLLEPLRSRLGREQAREALAHPPVDPLDGAERGADLMGDLLVRPAVEDQLDDRAVSLRGVRDHPLAEILGDQHFFPAGFAVERLEVGRPLFLAPL